MTISKSTKNNNNNGGVCAFGSPVPASASAQVRGPTFVFIVARSDMLLLPLLPLVLLPCRSLVLRFLGNIPFKGTRPSATAKRARELISRVSIGHSRYRRSNQLRHQDAAPLHAACIMHVKQLGMRLRSPLWAKQVNLCEIKNLKINCASPFLTLHKNSLSSIKRELAERGSRGEGIGGIGGWLGRGRI